MQGLPDHPASPRELVATLWRNRSLIGQMSWREVIGRYRGSVIGLAWSFLNPLLMLAVYTFVFSVVLNARWGARPDESTTDFAVFLFTGLILHGLMAECVNRAPGLIVSNVNFVKKVVFPIEVLPGVALGAALFHAAVSFVMLLAVQILRGQPIPPTALWTPVVLLPLVLGTAGLAWFLAGLGVFLRDVGHVTGVFTRIMLYVSAVMYPMSALPERFRVWLQFNPLAIVIDQTRKVLLLGEHPDAPVLGVLMLISVLMFIGGFAWFQKTRRGFADVL